MAVRVLSRRMNSPIPPTQAAAGFAAYEGAEKAYNTLKTFYKSHFEYSVTVSERDRLYGDIHDWLLSIMPDEKHRSLLVASARGSDDDMYSPKSESDDQTAASKPLSVRFDDDARRTVNIDGHRVAVQVDKPDVGEASKYGDSRNSKIIFSCRTYAGQQAVISHLNRINNDRKTSRKAVLKMVNQWGSWSTRSDLPPRTLESVSLPGNQMERIVADMEEFLASETRYNKLAIPWHRGYMFHGPPGTGKTSLVKALAGHFNLDLWYVSLADLSSEASLLGLISDVGPRSILLLEDIDTMKITHDRDGAEQGKISMSSLLNTLDGVATPHGLVSVMTTNRFDILDSALTRAGRMDLVEELAYPTIETLSHLFEHFYGKPWNRTPTHFDNEPIHGASTAQAAEIFKRNMGNPEQASMDLHAFLLELV